MEGTEMAGSVALLIIDVQKGLFARSTPVYRADELLGTINSLVKRAHAAGAPVVYVQHADKTYLTKGSDGWHLHPALSPVEGDLVVHKQHGNAFQQTILDTELKARCVGCVVIAGLVTHGCVRATCIGASELGYRTILAQDGHSSFSKQAAELIEKWNQQLSDGIVELRPAREIAF
jgi:nicotinamidase-related amidase